MPAPPAVESPPAPPAVGGGGVGERAGPPPVDDRAALPSAGGVGGAPGERCAACGVATVGPYCHACGERRPRPEDESVGHFLREQFHEVTSADGRMWRSLKALFVPGKLTEEYFAGRRGLYLRPVRLFLVANVVFFFALSVTGSTSSFLGGADALRDHGWFGAWATERLVEAAASEGVGQDVYDAAFNLQSHTLAASLIGLLVPGLALALGLTMAWRRVSALRSLVCATHFLAFAMAGTVALALVFIPFSLVAVWAGWVSGSHWISYSMDPVVGAALFLYLAATVTRVYAVRWWQAGFVTAVIGFGLLPAVTQGYQFALFLVTLWTVDVPTV